MGEIRVSCASLASIKIDDRYLLLLNKRSYKSGRMVYTPIGGALEYLPNGKKFLDNLGVKYERKTPDLRFTMDDDNLDLFKFWFSKGIDRERDVIRELREEMIEEENIFETLELNDVEASYIRTETPTNTINGVINHFFFEIYEVNFSQEKIEVIKEHINNQYIEKLMSEQEIKRGFTVDNIEIGNNVKSILL